MNQKTLLTLICLFGIISCVENNEEPFNFAIETKDLFSTNGILKDTGSVKFDDSVTSKQVIDEMGFGWNLGNTFDAFYNEKQNQGLESETCWNITKTTEEIIEGLVTRGFKTIRIPVTWHNHLIDQSYTIDPEWMKRVKTVVDWSISKGLYVILNTHHDNANSTDAPLPYGKGYYPLRKHIDNSEKFIYNIWRQIAIAFNNGYDHHLIFESLNEPRLIGSKYEWNFKKGIPECEESVSVLNEFLRLSVKAIRESGGNNAKRFIMVTPIAASYSAAVTSDFVFPGDRKYNPTNPKILLSVHMYLPYDYAMNSDMSFTTFEESYANELYSNFKDLYEKFVLNGHHVVVGEMGTVNKNNTESRIAWAKYYIENSRKFQLSCVLWDNEQFDNSKSATETFGMYHRSTISWENDKILDAYINTADSPLVDNPIEEYKDSLLSKPVELKDWLGNIQLGVGILSTFNSYCKLVIEQEDPFTYRPIYKNIKFFLGDWSNHFNISQEDIVGATVNVKGYLKLPSDSSTIEVALNQTNVQLAKERGIYIIGHGFALSKLAVEGPKLALMEPLTLTKSLDSNQKVTLTFSEDASELASGIKFSNDFKDLSVSCNTDSKDKKVVVCQGKFDTTGVYKVLDSKGVTLSGRDLRIEPDKSGKYDNFNIIETKLNLDDELMVNRITIDKSYFTDATTKAALVLKTSDLNVQPTKRLLYLYNGDSNTVLPLTSKTVSCDVNSDGSLDIPEGSQFINIALTDILNDAKENGIVMKGYGLSVDGVYIE